MGFAFSVGSGSFGGSRLRKTLLKHFSVPAGEIATAGRQFPIAARVDIQVALEDLMQPVPVRDFSDSRPLTLMSRRRLRKHSREAISRSTQGRFNMTRSTLVSRFRCAA
jgi:hypothetical protein